MVVAITIIVHTMLTKLQPADQMKPPELQSPAAQKNMEQSCKNLW